MQKQNRFGIVQVLFLIAALVAANVYVGARTPPLEAQTSGCSTGGVCEGDDTKCTFPVPLPHNYCEEYPGFTCSIATCEETALEP